MKSNVKKLNNSKKALKSCTQILQRFTNWKESSRNNTAGISMIEVLIGLFIIAITAFAASVIIFRGLQANRVTEAKIIAINLAREGIEAVRNMRDSNWLRYASRKNECWNFWENPVDSKYTCESSSPNRFANDAYYKIHFARSNLDTKGDGSGIPYTYKWFLTQETATNFIDKLIMPTDQTKLDQYKLKLFEMQKSVSPPSSQFVYVDDISHNISGGTYKAPITDFYRQMYIQYKDTNGGGININEDETFTVTSTVVWFEKGQMKSIKLQSDISNYL